MNTTTIVISSVSSFVSGVVIAYIVARLKSKYERENWEREFALKYLQAKSSGKKHAQEVAFQYAIGFFIVYPLYNDMAIGSPQKVPIPPHCRLIVGRDKDNDILIDDPSASRKHAIFTANASQVFVDDLHSRSGITLRREGIKDPITKTTQLKKGDLIEIGNTVIEYHRL